MTMPSRALVAVAVMTMGLSMPSLSMAAVSAPDNMVGVATARDAVPRRVVVRDREFVVAATGAPIVMRGPNVVVKGPPYLPAVEGTTICNDVVDAVCTKAGNCTSCETFNQVCPRGPHPYPRSALARINPPPADDLDPDLM
jgi:hypothetical protein